ncbi:sugar ABC transporter ATP-binding protein [Mesorhizobium sp.]|uniref:sugar ABC transporter ATP-binding protein n=1 Tax=Mesorhizobium sp. TaxID=1871066 RepID=UPI0025ED7C8F|nr:sugar ABC transporter ATP-binding protein [Mesorhizobium sp.]
MTGDVSAPLLLAQGISKHFGSFVALDGVSVGFRAGEVHAVTGENGAGKSTLMKILAGVRRPTAGRLWFAGSAVTFNNPAEAVSKGIATAFQEMSNLPNLTVAENLFLWKLAQRRGPTRHALREQAAEALARIQVPLAPSMQTASLTLGDQHLLEVAKTILKPARVYIFDEPTAALDGDKTAWLEGRIRALRAAGNAIIYISHRLPEIYSFCDTVTVLKDGSHIATAAVKDLPERELVRLMIGREATALFPARARSCGDGLDITMNDQQAEFHIKAGQITSLFGLEGHGQRETLRQIAGVDRGSRIVITKRATGDRKSAIRPQRGIGYLLKRGIAFLPEDRKAEGLFLSRAVHFNIAIGRLQRLAIWRRAPRFAAIVDEVLSRVRLVAGDLEGAVNALSGGNQQKVLLGRLLATGAASLLVEQPTRGVDVGSKAEIYELLRGFTSAGGAILMVSSDLQEVAGLSDRVLVFRDGRIVRDIPGAEVSEQAIMGAALGTFA